MIEGVDDGGIRPAFTGAIGACMGWIRIPMRAEKQQRGCSVLPAVYESSRGIS